MKVINNTKNTVYVEDIDIYLPYEKNKVIDINNEDLKRSKCLRGFIINGMLEIVEYNPEERIENSIAFLSKKYSKKHYTTEQTTEPENNDVVSISPLDKVSDEIEVKIHGIFLDAGGYAKVNRNIALKLHEAGVKVRVDPKRSVNQLTEADLEPIVRLQKTQISRNHILIDSIIPSFAEMSSGRYKVLYTTIESYSVPKQFIDCCQMYDEIWTTSRWSADILREVVDKPIYPVVTGVDETHYKEEGPKIDLKPNVKDFVFVSVFGWNYRKGYDVLLKAYLDEFSAEDNVTLLLVSRYQSGTSKFHKNKIKEDIDEIMKDFPNKDLPHIVRYSDVISENDMPSLYRSCNCFILSSRGEGGCTLPGTKIITEQGLRHIETIGEGSKVLTHKGRWRKVTSTRERLVSETIYEITSSLNSDTISLTSEHPCLVLKKDIVYKNRVKNKAKFIRKNCSWIIPSNISVGDYLFMPLNFCNKKYLTHIDSSKYLQNVIIENETIFRTGRNQYGRSFKHGNIKSLKKTINLNHKILQLIGFYVSEGCAKTKGGQITFTFHSSETKYHNIVKETLEKEFNVDVSVLQYNDDRKFRHCMSCTHSLLNEMLSNMCGRGSYNKRLPDFTWKLNRQQIQNLLYGVFSGDGSFYNPISSPSLSLSTVSSQLADDVVLALRMIGISSSKQNKKKRGYTVTIKGEQLNEINFIKSAHFHGHIKEVSVRTNEGIFIPVKEIKQIKYNGLVYNLEVDEDESYVTNCFSVHNCLPPLEASMCGLPVIMTNCSGQQGYLRQDNSFMLEIDRIAESVPGQFKIHYWDKQKFPLLTSQKVHDDLKGLMRQVVDNPQEAKKRNKRLQKLILEEFTWNNTANQAISRLKLIHEKIRER